MLVDAGRVYEETKDVIANEITLDCAVFVWFQNSYSTEQSIIEADNNRSGSFRDGVNRSTKIKDPLRCGNYLTACQTHARARHSAGFPDLRIP